MPDPRPKDPFAPTGNSRLLSWGRMGATVAAAAVAYGGITVAQAVALATTDDLGVTAVADPPALAAYTTGPAPTDAPAPVQAAAPSSGAVADAPEPLPRTRRRPAGGTSAPPSRDDAHRRSRPSASGREVAVPDAVSKRRQRLELKHAMWADRQLAAMLRAMSPATSLFGGGTWTTPVAYYHLTARFGESSSLWASTHTGLDFAAPTSTPVRAVTAGTVTSVGWAGAYGHKIEITHPDGSQTWYAHLSRTDVQVGAEVGTGDVIGAVGATGNVTGPHLHFEVCPGGGDPVDPEAALQEHGVRP